MVLGLENKPGGDVGNKSPKGTDMDLNWARGRGDEMKSHAKRLFTDVLRKEVILEDISPISSPILRAHCHLI